MAPVTAVQQPRSVPAPTLIGGEFADLVDRRHGQRSLTAARDRARSRAGAPSRCSRRGEPSRRQACRRSPAPRGGPSRAAKWATARRRARAAGAVHERAARGVERFAVGDRMTACDAQHHGQQRAPQRRPERHL